MIVLLVVLVAMATFRSPAVALMPDLTPKPLRSAGNAVINLGHGVSSMFLINKFFHLSLEEASAIRWHMGSYRTSDAEFDELQTCNENFMLVHLLQFADQLSLVKY